MMENIPGERTKRDFVFINKKKMNNDADNIQNNDISNEKNDSLKMIENLPNFIRNISTDQQNLPEKPILLNDNFSRDQINGNLIDSNQNFMEAAAAGPLIFHQAPVEIEVKKTMQYIDYSADNVPIFMARNLPSIVPIIGRGINFNGIPQNEPQVAVQNTACCCILPMNDSAIIPFANDAEFFFNQQLQQHNTGRKNQRIPRPISSRYRY